ncbi:MAG TPA: Ig-like domain-containing protein, partial [Chryseosolibacter sp.]
MRIFYVLIVAMLCLAQTAVCADYYIDLTGSDATGDGSIARPWRTLQYAVSKVPANQGHTIRLSAGTYIEAGRIDVPAGVNIEGSGKDVTILKASSSFYYYPASPGYATDKFLISLSGSSYASGNQSLKNFTIDGDGKKLHGGIYVRYRTFVTIDGVKVTGTNFTAIWLWDVKDSRMTNTDLVNCSWGSTGYQVGALNVGNLERVEIDHCYIDENTGYGIKAIGPSGYNDILYTKIHDCRITVNPTGLWNNGSAPNIAIELWQVDPLGCEIYSCYIDNTVSLVNANNNPSTGNQTIRVHHHVIDLASRANGAGYAIELTMHDVEIDHNYIVKGSYGIANWDNPMKNWNIHHNTFYNIEGTYPGEIVRSQWSGLHNVNFYNNTVEFAGTKTANLLGVYGGASDNINLKNNLIINSNTAYSYYPNQLIHMENGATLSVLAVTNNLLFNLPVGSVPGTYAGNLTGDPSVQKSGSRPDPYYLPNAGSPLIDAGINLGFPFLGGAPDIGAYEYAGSGPANTPPVVSIASPANNTSFTAGNSITISANASDTDGAVSKVEFFNGTTKLGEDLTSPYDFAWSNIPSGTYLLTAKATDDKGAATTSAVVSITVLAANLPPVVSITTPANNASFNAGSSVAVSATASDADGAVSKVEFFNGTTKLGEDLTSPYDFAWSNIPSGTYLLSAKATDDKGAATTSAVVSITVLAANLPPVVSITSPANNASFNAGNSVTINVNASDADGTISKVEFFRGTTKLGEDLTSPYSFAWTKVPAGAYTLTAKATDNLGVATTSAGVAITVNALPLVSITSPTA